MKLSSVFASLSLAVPALSVTTASTWSGGVLRKTAGTIQSVSGSFNVPSILPPGNGNDANTYKASVWIGIDGTGACFSGKGLMQAGVGVYTQNGDLNCYVWHEWYPYESEQHYTSPLLGCSPGNVMTVSITATSTTTGVTTVTNEDTGASQSFTYTSKGQQPLCLEYAEWIVEGHVGFTPDWEPVQFWNTQVTLTDGTSVDASGATPYYMVQSSTTMGVASVQTGTVSVDYTGP